MEEDEAQTHAAKIYNYQKGKGTKGFGAKLPNKPESVQKRFEKDWVKKGRKPF